MRDQPGEKTPHGADLIARLLSPHLSMQLGQSFYVENRAGAAGRIGTGVVAKSDPDGQTLLMTTESSLVIAPHIGVAMNYDPFKDFAPISLLTRNTVILVVHPSVPANTAMQEPAVKDILLRDGSEIVVSRPDEFRQVIENDYAKYGKLAHLLKGAQ